MSKEEKEAYNRTLQNDLTKAIIEEKDGKLYTVCQYGKSELVTVNDQIKLSTHVLYLVEVDNEFEFPIYYRPIIHFINYTTVPPFELVKDIKKKDSFLILNEKSDDPPGSWLPQIVIHVHNPDENAEKANVVEAETNDLGALYKDMMKPKANTKR